MYDPPTRVNMHLQPENTTRTHFTLMPVAHKLRQGKDFTPPFVPSGHHRNRSFSLGG